MSLPPIIYRDIGDEVPDSKRVIYDAYINALSHPSRTSPERAILRAAERCGVSRQRVLEVVRQVNIEALPMFLWGLDTNPRVM